MNYYNEFNPIMAGWIKQLIVDELIPAGDVDERSIEDVTPADIAGYTQCHFFAGIGGWSAALAIAGVSDDTPVWTGSCPCQPFSTAGKAKGFDDERHLWPAFQWLIQQCEPAVVLGEQVASKVADSWIDLVQADLEAMGYAFGCVPFPSASIGAPHIRDRTYWGAARMANTVGSRWPRASRGSEEQEQRITQRRMFGDERAAWGNVDWLRCTDGSWRPVESGTFPMANGIPERVGRLRGYGNAINPYQAATFIRSFSEALT